MYPAIESALILALYMCKDRRGVNPSNLTCLRMSLSLGEKVSRHEMTLCDFCLRGCLSSLQHHDLTENLSCQSAMCFLLLINKKII